MDRFPTIEEAEQILREAESCNPGPWGDHSRTAAYCARQIASQCPGMDPDKAYVLGLLHDIGRKFGISHLGHVYDGWKYMLSLGWEDAARICLTHSFTIPSLNCYIGKLDISIEKQQELTETLIQKPYDEYDLLIQLCDCLAGAGAVVDMESRMQDVKARYGSYPQEKWDRNMELKAIFEKRIGCGLYDIL